MSQYPPQPPYEPNNNNQYPYNPQQPPYGQPPTQYPGQPPYNPQQLPAFPQPAQNTQYPVQPQMPPQDPSLSGVRQPKKKAPTFKETWNSGASGKCGIIAVVSILLLVVFGCVGFMHIATSASPNAPVQTSQSGATAVQVTQSTTKSQPTTKPTVAAQIVATHGTPLFGGPYSDFIGKYGQPVIQGIANSETFAPTPDQIIVNVTPDKGKVTRMIITGPDNWTEQQTESFCTAFLPADASEFNRTAGDTPFIDYHSSMGEIVVSIQSQACIIYLGGQ